MGRWEVQGQCKNPDSSKTDASSLHAYGAKAQLISTEMARESAKWRLSLFPRRSNVPAETTRKLNDLSIHLKCK